MEWFNNLLNGKKTIIGIIGAIATFIVVITNSLGDGFQMEDLNIMLGGFSALMLAIGLNHKAEKLENTLKK